MRLYSSSFVTLVSRKGREILIQLYKLRVWTCAVGEMYMWVFGCCVDSSGSEGAFLGTGNLSGSVFTSCNVHTGSCSMHV